MCLRCVVMVLCRFVMCVFWHFQLFIRPLATIKLLRFSRLGKSSPLDLFSLVYFESILCSRLTVEINRNKIPIRDLVQEDRDDQFLVRLEAKLGKEDEV